MLRFPCTIRDFVTTRHFIFFLSAAALLLVPAVAADEEAGNKTNGQVVLVNLPLQIEDAIVSAAVAAGSGDNEDGAEEIRKSPAIIRGEESSNGKLTAAAPDNSGEDIGYVGAGLLGAAIGAGLGAAWGGTGSNYGANFYQQGYNPGIYGGYPYAPVVGYPQTYPGYPLPAGYRPPRPDSFYPPPSPAYGDPSDYFYADAKAADGLSGFGSSYPGYYSELLAAGTASSPALKATTDSSIGSISSSSSGQKKQPSSSSSTTGGGATSGYPIDWSAVAEAYYGSDVSSRSYYPSAHQHQTEDEPTAIFVSDSYPFLFDDY